MTPAGIVATFLSLCHARENLTSLLRLLIDSVAILTVSIEQVVSWPGQLAEAKL